MKEILIVAPYYELYEVAKELIEKNNYENISVISGDFCSKEDLGGLQVEEGIRVIISRGGTYTTIKNTFKNLTTIEIEISAYDIISCIKEVIDKEVPVAVIGFDNVIYGVELLEGLKRLNIHKIKLDKSIPMELTISKCIEQGVTTFIGDTFVEKACLDIGVECHLIKTGVPSLTAAIERATEIISATKKEIERNKRFAALMDCVRDGVIATDESNRVVEYNAIAREILNVNKNELIGYTANEVFGGLNSTDGIKQIKGTKVTIKKVPINVLGENKGYVAVFQDVKKLQNYEKNVRKQLLGDGFVAKYNFEDIIHKSSEMEKTINIAKKFSAYNSSMLIYGKSGVGKELFAQSIHNISDRQNGPFVAVNCAALPQSLIESEFFGYEEGAFTGSKKGGRAGVFEMAHKGTIFLDEISELPFDIQGRLLRVIQEKEVMRLGDSKINPIDIRVICATNKDLRKMVNEGLFREDLLFRINVLVFKIPTLNEREGDVEILSYHFLEKYAEKYGKAINRISGEAIQYLRNYKYEGNVRELQNIIERAVIICEKEEIEVSDFNDGLSAEGNDTAIKDSIFDSNYSLKEMEDMYIEHVYMSTNKSVKETCDILDIDRSTLWRKKKMK